MQQPNPKPTCRGRLSGLQGPLLPLRFKVFTPWPNSNCPSTRAARSQLLPSHEGASPLALWHLSFSIVHSSSPASMASKSPPHVSHQGGPSPGHSFPSIPSCLEPQAHPAGQHRGPDPRFRPQFREPEPGPAHPLVSSALELRGPSPDPPSKPSPVPRSPPPRYHGDPCPDPRGPGPAETGRLRLRLQFWGPGL